MKKKIVNNSGLIIGLLLFSLLLSGCGLSHSSRFKSAPVNESSDLISGRIIKPKGEGPFPAIIILHGCGGLDSHHIDWANRFARWGYVAFPIDSFNARGHSNVCTKYWKVSFTDRAQDAVGAALYLKQLPYVDGDNIGIMGFSHGGKSVIEATKENLIRYIAKIDKFPYKAATAFYPRCVPFLDQNIAVPMQIHIGEKDDWTLAHHCESLPKLNVNAIPVQVFIYEGAYHGFDRDRQSLSYLGHRFEYNSEATMLAVKRTKDFFDHYLKPR